MGMQAEAEQKKRAQILESEEERQPSVNIADGKKSSMMLEVQGEAEAILARSQATNKGVALVSQALQENGGVESKLEADLARRTEHYSSENMRVIKDTLQSDEASSSRQSNKRGSTHADYKKVRKEMAGDR
ncbi:hypothetical protein Ccrd_024972 [Cynara cardunculus var. scolymus]|uniref:Uncharacterized protein n=1 Tax=Cynara cardunculus var. scolymus TaxID=59895 RepID=A0A103XBM8_CYNCS|nr:hypothetical protein Ccrd_024972 [Cynara cardunculus var. scolymus]